jgi:hypothetical protein
MSVWLSPTEVAERLGVSRKTAVSMMYQMPHSVICGSERKRIRVSEDTLEAWLLKRTVGNPVVNSKSTGTKKKLQRR